ncbi:MAG: tetratricopeptide repeat protein [Aggregatilineaceae bacterium]
MDQNDINARIGIAWRAHYLGKHQDAIEQFAKILSEAPDHIDAHWGLGLSYRRAGEREKARQAFEKVAELAAQALQNEPENRERYFMLQRMAKQQIEQIAEFLI